MIIEKTDYKIEFGTVTLNGVLQSQGFLDETSALQAVWVHEGSPKHSVFKLESGVIYRHTPVEFYKGNKNGNN